MYLVGFALWIIIGIVAAVLARVLYSTPGTLAPLTFAFGLFGSFIGGMLGVSGYIFHDPSPLRFGGILGAVLGGLLFVFMYHVVARKAI